MADYQDQTLTCGDCGVQFTFTAGEQEFYAQKDLSAPKRCKDCRQKKRAEFQANRQETEVKCDGCGVTTTVPFVPRGDKPIYCRDCFDKQKTGAPMTAANDNEAPAEEQQAA